MKCKSVNCISFRLVMKFSQPKMLVHVVLCYDFSFANGSIQKKTLEWRMKAATVKILCRYVNYSIFPSLLHFGLFTGCTKLIPLIPFITKCKFGCNHVPALSHTDFLHSFFFVVVQQLTSVVNKLLANFSENCSTRSKR